MRTLLVICAACLVAGVQPVMGQEAQPLDPSHSAKGDRGLDAHAIWICQWWAALHAIPMADMDQCEMAGAEFTASKRLYPHGDYRGFECLEGIR